MSEDTVCHTAQTRMKGAETEPRRHLARPAIERSGDKTVIIRSLSLAKKVLRRTDLRQAGFNADLVALLPQKNTSVLFMWGAAHRRQRSAVARFFAPAEVTRRYRPLMVAASERIVARLKAETVVALDEMTLDVTVAVAAEIVGLRNSLRPGLGTRLNHFFEMTIPQKGLASKAVYVARCHWYMLLVYLIDVRPALRAARRHPRLDLVSHLVAERWSTLDALTECITYAAAGISTTREFMVAAAWHLLEDEDLRRRFLDGAEEERCALVEEILRIEPAVPRLYRRATAAFTLVDAGCSVEVEAGTLIVFDVEAANQDANAVGTCPYGIDPNPPSGHARHLSFGEGAHRCPGATVAILEVVAFLDVLLRAPGIRLVSAPSVTWNATTSGYVLRGGAVSSRPQDDAPSARVRPARMVTCPCASNASHDA